MPPTSLSFTILFVIALSYIALSTADKYEYGYRYSDMIDQFQSLNPRTGRRFLKEKIKKGARCDAKKETICSGSVTLRNTTELLTCCKNHCRNLLRDRNNCGECGIKCGFGQLCCNGVCTGVASDANNCGKCAHVCKSGVRCEFGVCGYA